MCVISARKVHIYIEEKVTWNYGKYIGVRSTGAALCRSTVQFLAASLPS